MTAGSWEGTKGWRYTSLGAPYRSHCRGWRELLMGMPICSRAVRHWLLVTALESQASLTPPGNSTVGAYTLTPSGRTRSRISPANLFTCSNIKCNQFGLKHSSNLVSSQQQVPGFRTGATDLTLIWGCARWMQSALPRSSTHAKGRCSSSTAN